MNLSYKVMFSCLTLTVQPIANHAVRGLNQRELLPGRVRFGRMEASIYTSGHIFIIWRYSNTKHSAMSAIPPAMAVVPILANPWSFSDKE